MTNSVKGANSMVLNEATMIFVLQHYFDTVMFRAGAAPKVTGVKKNNDAFNIDMHDAPCRPVE